jgi:HEPN domain-containing protein
MSGDDRQASVQWAEALLWLAKADEDLAAGQILLTNGLYDPAAFHV